VWTTEDIGKFLYHGNEAVNKNLLPAFPVWTYQPTPNDSISLKEQWISQKYKTRTDEENEKLKQPPKHAGNEIHPIQFCRRSKSGNEPCAAILHKDKLYLRSEKRKEDVSIVDVETALLTQDNGIMLAYRDRTGASDEYRFAHLNHDDPSVVLDWVNTLLYMKYCILRQDNPQSQDKDIGKLLNRYVIRQSYVTAGTQDHPQLLFFVLSESRLAVFEHHLDEKPKYQTRIYQNHLSSVQYLTEVGNALQIQVEKVYGYDEWLQALDLALNNKRLCSIPERREGPPSMGTRVAETQFTASSNLQLKQPAQNSLSSQPIGKPANQVQTSSYSCFNVQNAPASGRPFGPIMPPSTISEPTAASRPDRVSPIDSLPTTQPPTFKTLTKEHCYPAIPPMGEMGKVHRGELSAEAIRPPVSKQLSNGLKEDLENGPPPVLSSKPPIMNNTQYDMKQNETSTTFATHCYPPIGPGHNNPSVTRPLPPSVPPSFNDRSHPPPVVPRHGPQDHIPDYQNRYDRRPSHPIGQYGGLPPMTKNYDRYPPPSHQNGRAPDFLRSNSVPNHNFNPMNRPPWERSNSSKNHFFSNSSNHSSPSPPNQWSNQRPPSGSWDMGAATNQFKPSSVSPSNWGSSGDIQSNSRSDTPEIWRRAEHQITDLIMNGIVPASDMRTAGLDPNQFSQAEYCADELFSAIKDEKYEMALSFLRGFREVFRTSNEQRITDLFLRQGELATLRKIVFSRVQNGKNNSNLKTFPWNGPSSEVSSPWDRSSRGSLESKFSSQPSWKSAASQRSPFDYNQQPQDRWNSGNAIQSTDIFSKIGDRSSQNQGGSLWEQPQEKKSWNAPNRDIWRDKPSPSQFQNFNNHNFRGSPSGSADPFNSSNDFFFTRGIEDNLNKLLVSDH